MNAHVAVVLLSVLMLGLPSQCSGREDTTEWLGSLYVRNDSDARLAAVVVGDDGSVMAGAGWTIIRPRSETFVGQFRSLGAAYAVLADQRCEEVYRAKLEPPEQTLQIGPDGTVSLLEGRLSTPLEADYLANCLSAFVGVWAVNRSEAGIVLHAEALGDKRTAYYYLRAGQSGWMSYLEDVDLGRVFTVYSESCEFIGTVDLPTVTAGIVIDRERRIQIATDEVLAEPAYALVDDPPMFCTR